MQQDQIHNYLERYFEANECEILENKPGLLNVHLTVSLDKILMNRPFYWHYLEKTGGEPNPMKLAFITDPKKAPKDIKGENLHFGSPRLHQIFQSTKSLGAYIRMYENIESTKKISLQPWLGLNIKISYQCNHHRDVILSLGLNLINGTIVDHFHKRVSKLDLTPKIPDYCFTLTPMIKVESGLNRMKNLLKDVIDNDDHSWAEESIKRLDGDINILNHFYEGIEEKPESYHVEKEALQELYEPKIKVRIINGGIFYVTDGGISKDKLQ